MIVVVVVVVVAVVVVVFKKKTLPVASPGAKLVLIATRPNHFLKKP